MMIRTFRAVSATKIKLAFGAGLCAVVLSGCGGADSVAGKVISGGRAPIEVTPETFAPPVPCPPMQLKPNTYLIMNYVRGKQNEPSGLRYQATVEEWAVTCTSEADGGRRMKLGFSGDVTPGPAWQGGDIVLPLRVAVVPGGEDEKPLSSEILKIPVSIAAGAPAETWTLIENKFTIPAGASVKIVFGFDEGRRR
ncbi:hypothetical protein [uncultured Roseibium sp.]|uniref:hypothetical protein n=1 Tax=uncultured Roseibium sp. TaxID=1936171 RepID=UPI0026029E7A|nr:hypothetical protein [uncultured Roseibium sp.]